MKNHEQNLLLKKSQITKKTHTIEHELYNLQQKTPKTTDSQLPYDGLNGTFSNCSGYPIQCGLSCCFCFLKHAGSNAIPQVQQQDCNALIITDGSYDGHVKTYHCMHSLLHFVKNSTFTEFINQQLNLSCFSTKTRYKKLYKMCGTIKRKH